MHVTEALDREVIVERAEVVRFWLLGQHLSSRATGAIQRELGAIIDNDPGTYINGQRPLAGLTVADFIGELHRPNGGAVARVKSVGYAALNELREKIPADTRATASEPQPDYTVPELDAPEVPVLEAATPGLATPVAEAPQADAAEAKPVRRGPGRPKGATKAAQNGGAVSQEAPAPAATATQPLAELPAPVALIVAEPIIAELPATVEPKSRRGPGRPKGATKAARNGLVAHQEATASAPTPVVLPAPPVTAEAAPPELPATAEPTPRRGRPRRDAAPPSVVASLPNAPTANRSAIIAPVAPALPPAPAEDRIAPVTHDGDDPMLKQLARLWPALHPHARRAVVIYASTLWAETTTHEE